MESTTVFQNKRKNSEKGGFFFFPNMFTNLFSIWLNRR